MYFSTNAEAYQVFDCNVETYGDWMQTLQYVDVIYPSGPEGELRIMYELGTYEKVSLVGQAVDQDAIKIPLVWGN